MIVEPASPERSHLTQPSPPAERELAVTSSATGVAASAEMAPSTNRATHIRKPASGVRKATAVGTEVVEPLFTHGAAKGVLL